MSVRQGCFTNQIGPTRADEPQLVTVITSSTTLHIAMTLLAGVDESSSDIFFESSSAFGITPILSSQLKG